MHKVYNWLQATPFAQAIFEGAEFKNKDLQSVAIF